MRQVFVIALFLAGFSVGAWAESQSQVNTQQSNQAQNNSEILFYAEPNTDKILKRLSPNAQLIPIYQKEEWLKMGDPTDGQVGWVNTKQYQEARANYYRPDIQTIYVHTTQGDQGKPVLNIVAYKNGQPLSQAEAQKLYQELRDEQQQQMKRMQQFSYSMQSLMERDFRDMEGIFGSFWKNSPWADTSTTLPASNSTATAPKN